MWKLAGIADIQKRPDGTILVIFKITNGIESEVASMGLDGKSSPDEINQAIQDYIDTLNAPVDVPPSEAFALLDSMQEIVGNAQALNQEVAAVLEKTQAYIDLVRAAIK